MTWELGVEESVTNNKQQHLLWGCPFTVHSETWRLWTLPDKTAGRAEKLYGLQRKQTNPPKIQETRRVLGVSSGPLPKDLQQIDQNEGAEPAEELQTENQTQKRKLWKPPETADDKENVCRSARTKTKVSYTEKTDKEPQSPKAASPRKKVKKQVDQVKTELKEMCKKKQKWVKQYPRPQDKAQVLEKQFKFVPFSPTWAHVTQSLVCSIFSSKRVRVNQLPLAQHFAVLSSQKHQTFSLTACSYSVVFLLHSGVRRLIYAKVYEHYVCLLYVNLLIHWYIHNFTHQGPKWKLSID